MGTSTTTTKETPLQGASRHLVDALSLSEDRAIMDRIWDLLDEVEGPGHAPATRKRLLTSNPSATTLEMLHERNRLYPLSDFATTLTGPGFMSLIKLVGAGPLLDDKNTTRCLLTRWLTRPGVSINAKQAVDLVDAMASPDTIEALSASVWQSFFLGEKKGNNRALLEPAVLHLSTHGSKFTPKEGPCLEWLISTPYGKGRYRGPLIDLVLTRVFPQPTIEQAQDVSRTALEGFRKSIVERDDDMACTFFKETNSQSLNPRRLRHWLDSTPFHADPRILGMLVGSLAHAASCPGQVARLGERMVARALRAPALLDEVAVSHLLQEVVAIIMPARPPAQGSSTAMAAATARLELRHEQAWNQVIDWAKTMPAGPLQTRLAEIHAIATTSTTDSTGYEARRQSILLHLNTQALAPGATRGPRF